MRLGNESAALQAFRAGPHNIIVRKEGVDRKKFTEGFFGIVGRGLLDFEVSSVTLQPGDNQPAKIALNECHVCYALGHTLTDDGGQWRCRFVGLFRNEGGQAEIRPGDARVVPARVGPLPQPARRRRTPHAGRDAE